MKSLLQVILDIRWRTESSPFRIQMKLAMLVPTIALLKIPKGKWGATIFTWVSEVRFQIVSYNLLWALHSLVPVEWPQKLHVSNWLKYDVIVFLFQTGLGEFSNVDRAPVTAYAYQFAIINCIPPTYTPGKQKYFLLNLAGSDPQRSHESSCSHTDQLISILWDIDTL